jgi:phospholipase/carboxylesterase
VDPHRGQPALVAGAPPERAGAAIVAVHGRGASPEDILPLAAMIGGPGFAYVAPRAAGGTWYPYRFLEPIERNQPWLDSALGVLAATLHRLGAAGVPPERTLLLGFSQGACLALEFAARNARRYGGLVGFSGALIGPPDTPRNYGGSLEGTPVFLGCSDRDPHVPADQVLATADTLRALGGEVTARLYPGLGHTVNDEEIEAARAIARALTVGAQRRSEAT